MPVALISSNSSRSSVARAGSGFGSPDGRVSAFLASRAALSKGPPIPTPTVRGGLALGPAFSIVSTTNSFMAGRPSAGGEHPQGAHVVAAGALDQHRQFQSVTG